MSSRVMATGLKRMNYADIGLRLSHNFTSHNNKSRKQCNDVQKQRRSSSFNLLEDIILEATMEAERLSDVSTISDSKNRTNKIIQNGSTSANEENDEHNNEKTNEFISTEHVTRRERKKDVNKLHVNKKHFSDYDVVYLHVDSHDEEKENDVSGSAETLNNNLKNVISRCRSNSDFRSSDPNITSSLPPSGRIIKSSSHRDITSTQTYKDIYTDNLRQYGFLLAKQLGTSNKSPDQLRKTYLKNRKKALERREKSFDKSESGRRKSDIPVMSSPIQYSHSNILDHDKLRSTESLTLSKYSDSLTDIANIGSEEDLHHVKKSQTVIIRRKHNKHEPRDPNKRLSAPLLTPGVDIDDLIKADKPDKQRKISMPELKPTDSMSAELKPTRSMSMLPLNGAADTSNVSSGSEADVMESNKSLAPNRRVRKISIESQRRQDMAKIRQDYRKSRLTSFDEMLMKADKLTKDIKRKTSSTLSPIITIDENNKLTAAST